MPQVMWPAALTTANPIEQISQRISNAPRPSKCGLATDATAYSKTYTELNGAVNIAKAGDIFTFDYDGTIITTTVPRGQSKVISALQT